MNVLSFSINALLVCYISTLLVCYTIYLVWKGFVKRLDMAKRVIIF